MASLWAALVSKVGTQPGLISAHTMRILKELEPSGARAFQKLCAYTVSVEHDGVSKLITLTCGPFDCYSLTRDEGDLLDEAGLTHIHDKGVVVFRDMPFSPDGTAIVTVGGEKLCISRNEESDPCLVISQLTNAGKELASICGVGGAPGLKKAIVDAYVGARALD